MVCGEFQDASMQSTWTWFISLRADLQNFGYFSPHTCKGRYPASIIFLAQLQLSWVFFFFKLKIVSLTHFLERFEQYFHPTICSHISLHNQCMQKTSSFPLFPTPPPHTTSLCWLKLFYCSCQSWSPAASCSLEKEL